MPVATWVGYPASYTKRRDHTIQYIVVHYTAGSEGPLSAEAGASYDKRRTDGTSTHVFADSNSVVREVPDHEVAHAAFYHGNHAGLQLEICGTAQTRLQWLDETSAATLRMAAKQCVEWCRAYGVPARRLSVAETRAAWYAPAGQRPKGFVGHVDVTHAYPEDGGNHTDPGPDFPWDVFLGFVQEELGSSSAPPSIEEDDDVKGIILQDPHSIVLLYIHPVLGIPVWTNIVDGEAIDNWAGAGFGPRLITTRSIHDFGRDANAVAKELLDAIRAGGGGGPIEVKVTPGPMRATTSIEPVGE